MRAKFVVEVPAASSNSFPTNEDFESRLISLGLGEQGRAQAWDDRVKKYLDEADVVWDQFPEVAQSERDYVVFFARLPYHGRLIVTRYDEGYAVFRVLNEDLAKLESGTERLVRALTSKSAALPGLVVVDDEIEIYERGYDRVLIRGHVISSPLKETVRRHGGNVVTLTVTGIAALVTILLLNIPSLLPGGIAVGTVERFSTAMLATFFVTAATLAQVWFSLKRKKQIDWVAVSTT